MSKLGLAALREEHHARLHSLLRERFKELKCDDLTELVLQLDVAALKSNTWAAYYNHFRWWCYFNDERGLDCFTADVWKVKAFLGWMYRTGQV